MHRDKIILAGLFLLLVTESRVYAYTDPGSGTLILQLLLAAIFSAMFYVRRLVTWVRGLKKGGKETQSTEPSSAPSEGD